MPPEPHCNRGDVVLVLFPHSDLKTAKTRPAVVVGIRGRNVELLPITSSDRRHHLSNGYVEVADLKSAGLHRKCGINL